MGKYRVEVAGWVVFDAPDDEAARTTASGLNLGYPGGPARGRRPGPRRAGGAAAAGSRLRGN